MVESTYSDDYRAAIVGGGYKLAPPPPHLVSLSYWLARIYKQTAPIQ